MVEDGYMDILAIISKFLGARWMNLDLFCFNNLFYIMGETKSIRNSTL